MLRVKDDQFIAVHGWMRTRLGLCSNDLWLFALIYSYNKSTQKEFYGSVSYMEEWIGE